MEQNRQRSAGVRRTERPSSEERRPAGQQHRPSGETSRRRTAEERETPVRRTRPGGTEGSRRPSSERSAQRRPTAGETPRRGRPEPTAEPTGERKRPRTGSAQSTPAEARTTERRQPPSSQRSERSIKAEKKRKALRAENARLHRLRQQQKRKARRRIVKRINKGLFKRLLVMAGVVIAVLLTMIIFFRVEPIQVEGASYYSAEEVIEACGVAEGDNLLTLSRGKISGNIMARLKYVDSVKVSRELPNTLVIRITESSPRYAVQDTGGVYYLMTAQGKVVEQITPPTSAKEFIIVEELTIQPPAMGEEIQIFDPNGDPTKISGQLASLKILLAAIEEANLGRHIASVQVPSSFKITLWYEDRFLVELGNTTRIDYKLEYLKAVVNNQESYVTGTVDLTLRDGDKAILLPES